MRYDINEFVVDSEFALPCDTAGCSPRDRSEADHVTIRRASLADIPCTMRRIRRQLIYDVGDGFLLDAPGVALHIDFRGRTLTVDCSDTKLEVASAWAIHAGLGAATLTHGGVPLHGAGLEVAGRYIAVIADSGAGKSTLSWFLLRRGAHFGNDDLVPIRLGGNDAMAFPSVSLYPKLSREAVDQHGLEIADLLPADYGTGEEEYYVPLPTARRVTSPRPLAAVFLIRPQSLPLPGLIALGRMRDLVMVRQIPEDEAAVVLRRNLHAVWLIGRWMDERKLSALCCHLAARVPVYVLTYPRSFAILPALAARITQIVGES